MAELEGRTALEQELAKLFGIELTRQQRNILRALEGTDDLLAAVMALDLWERERIRIGASITPALQSIFLASAAQLLEAQPVGVDWAVINDRGTAWAGDYSFELVRNLNETTLTTLQREVSRAMDEGLSIGDIRSRLAPTFGPVRAELIATTETTRAATEGQREFIAQLETLGVRTIASWLTARDEIVRACPICWPLDGIVRENGVYRHPNGGVFGGPPAHPRCRCAEIFDLEETAPDGG